MFMSQMTVWKWESGSLSRDSSKMGCQQQKAHNVAEAIHKVLKPLKNQEVYGNMKLGIVGDLLDFIFPCIFL